MGGAADRVRALPRDIRGDVLKVPILGLAKKVLGWALPALAMLHPDPRVRQLAADLAALLSGRPNG